jgi:hypothetical protein
MIEEYIEKEDTGVTLEDAVSDFFEEIDKQEESQSEAKEESKTENKESIDKTETETETEEDVEELDEEIEEEEDSSIGESEKLERELQGFVSEYRELVNSIEDPELKMKAIEAGKKQRASIDRKLSEIGEQKKLNREALENYSKMDRMFNENPKGLIELLATQANIKIEDLVKPAQREYNNDEDDYRTPEEIKRDQELEDIKSELKSLKDQKREQEQLTVQQEIIEFQEAKDEKGNLKHPHFERVKANMGILITQPNMTMEKAYEKAILLDDELMAEREREILKKAELKRKEKIEKAKKLKKQSISSSKIKSITTNPDSLLEQAYDNLMISA